jgi:hypothetical protein
MTKPTNADLARELVAAKAHIAELEAARPDHIEQPAVDLTVASSVSDYGSNRGFQSAAAQPAVIK